MATNDPTTGQMVDDVMSYPTPKRRSLWRSLGFIGVLLVLAAAIGGVFSVKMAHVDDTIKPFPVIPREKYQHAPGPITLALHGLQPTVNGNSKVVPVASADVRAIRVYGTHIDLYAGGKVIKVINFTQPVIGLHDIAQLVNNPAWLQEQPGGKFQLKVALVADSRSHVTLAAPAVTNVLLVNGPSTLIGVQQGGSLSLDGVNVDCSLTALTDPTKQPRAAVVATNSGNMDIVDSHFSHLGWDGNASYGVSWNAGATGKAINSTFEHSFMGVYTSRVANVQFVHDTFSYNMLYGLDPHTYSTKLVITNVTAEHNGAHGIIFSDHVTASTITGSVSRYNGENGIMMDKFSTNNTITGNTVAYNTGDGLVTAKSGHNTISDNRVNGNRVGVRVDKGDAASCTVINNTVTANKAASEGASLNGTNTTSANGGQWRLPVLARIWEIVGAAFVLLSLLTVLAVAVHRNHMPRQRLHAAVAQ